MQGQGAAIRQTDRQANPNAIQPSRVPRKIRERTGHTNKPAGANSCTVIVIHLQAHYNTALHIGGVIRCVARSASKTYTYAYTHRATHTYTIGETPRSKDHLAGVRIRPSSPPYPLLNRAKPGPRRGFVAEMTCPSARNAARIASPPGAATRFSDRPRITNRCPTCPAILR